MSRLTSFSIAAKAIVQLGPGPLGLYGLYRLGLRTGHFRRAEANALESGASSPVMRDVFPVPSPAQVLDSLGDAGRVDLLREATEIVRGRVRLFGGGPVPIRLTFKGRLRHWTEYETGKAPLPVSHSAAAHSAKSQLQDLKFLWEPARFGWAFTLGRAFHVSRNEKYAEAFWKYLRQFERGNPPYMGPHWMSGQEVAIRLMALVWSAQLFQPAAASTRSRRDQLMRSIAKHAARIPPTLIYARSQNNNHLVVESAALYTAGVALDHKAWRDIGWHWLNYALCRQIGSYGEYVQHSTNYHRLMLQTALWVDAILRGRHEPWPVSTRMALERASHWLFSMIDPASGQAPNLGANDGGLILPLSSVPFGDFRPTVQAAARAFLRTSLPPGQWDELPVWLSLPAATHTADSDAYAGEHLRGHSSWAYMRASSFRSRLSHMDQLHFDLWWRGLNILQDAGTYRYDAPPPWDNPLVSTRIHNTVTVDGRDQMTRGGRFLTLDWIPAYSKRVIAADPHVLGRMLAHHAGYRRLGIRHERLASVYADGRWEVRDDLIFTMPGDHLFRLHWLLPDWPWRIKKTCAAVEIRLRSPHGWIRLILQIDPLSSNLASQLSIVRAGRLMLGTREELPFEGWSSPTYGRKVPALSVALEVESRRSFAFLSTLTLPG